MTAPLQPCGSHAAYHRHLWRGQAPCDACKAAHADHERQRRAANPLRATWQGMVRRCTDPRRADYRYYGGRGIRVFEPWRTDPAAFIAWVTENLGPRPDGMTLDRVDNDQGYVPGNLRWSTAVEQARNSRNYVPERCAEPLARSGEPCARPAGHPGHHKSAGALGRRAAAKRAERLAAQHEAAARAEAAA